MSGHFKSTKGLSAFPKRPQFSGFMKSCRFEGEIQHLEVRGEIPQEIDGTFYRWFNGDGIVIPFRIRDGHCHFKQRYVRTEKFVTERKAEKAVVCKYRKKYTDAVELKIRTTANTNVLYFDGRLLACKEDAPPYSLDPESLETIGLEDFDGQLPSLTFTAHQKFDDATGELVCFGFGAKGDGTPDVCCFTVNKEEKVVETVWLVCPLVAKIHDFAITENWTCDVERMKQGGEHWQWDPDVPFYLGVIPRRGASGGDVKWFRAPNAFPGHTVNAYEDEAGNVVFDLPLVDKNVFFWWPDINGNAPKPEIAADLVRFTFDPHSDNLELPKPEILHREDCKFPRINDKFSGRKHEHAFMDLMDPSLGTEFLNILPRTGGGFPPYNCLARLDYRSLRLEKYLPGRTHLVQKPIFIARQGEDASEADDRVLALPSELHIVDTRDFESPQAIVDLPIRLRAGLHGNWVNAR
ncbi:carotenoid oxygenase [Boeremia exigua]|uniref:carotenoid oxygenase n=1 Tax=Boeremia exigua TaxID=749465 RepID=UPI001E8CB9A3|nr:carotenoid oxygenase [Boeremia exigua]KAH6620596.1 carotenoid oxygenase [Boeremia exigua]